MSALQFNKSSHSTGDGECVEVAVNVPETVAVRDSKDTGRTYIRCTPTPWAAFTSALARGRLGRT